MDYYTPVSDDVFAEIKSACLEIWDSYDDTYGYATKKKDRIKDLENIQDNALYMINIFDWMNQAKLAEKLSEKARLEISERTIAGGGNLIELCVKGRPRDTINHPVKEMPLFEGTLEALDKLIITPHRMKKCKSGGAYRSESGYLELTCKFCLRDMPYGEKDGEIMQLDNIRDCKGRCEYSCDYELEYGFVPEAGCPIHD